MRRHGPAGLPALRSWPILACLALLVGCTAWEPVTTSPVRLIAEERPSAVRITTSDGTRSVFETPTLVDDSVASAAEPAEGPGRGGSSRLCLTCGDVRVVEVERFSAVRTLALAATIGLAAAGWASMVGGSEGGSTDSPEPVPKRQGLWGEIRFLLRVAR